MRGAGRSRRSNYVGAIALSTQWRSSSRYTQRSGRLIAALRVVVGRPPAMAHAARDGRRREPLIRVLATLPVRTSPYVANRRHPRLPRYRGTARGRRAPARAGGALHIPGTHRLRHPRSPIRGAAARGVRVSRNLRSLLLTRIGHMPYGYAALERWPVGALTVLGGRRKITTSNHKAR